MSDEQRNRIVTGRGDIVKVGTRGRLPIPARAYSFLERPTRVCTFVSSEGTMMIGNHDDIMPRLERGIRRYLSEGEDAEERSSTIQLFLSGIEAAEVYRGRRILIPNQLEEMGNPREVVFRYNPASGDIEVSPRLQEAAYPLVKRREKYPIILSGKPKASFFNQLRQR